MRILKLCILLLVFASCKGQEGTSFWQADKVTRLNGKPMWGLTLSYMDMIAEMQIHFYKNKDSLIFSYPKEEMIKIADFKSFSNFRLERGELVDSIYDISVVGKNLEIKFYYQGRKEEDKFVLKFKKVDPKTHFATSQQLKAKKTKLMSQLQTIDASALNLSIAIPKYFYPDVNLAILNPIQTAQMLSSDEEVFQAISDSSSFTIKGEKAYQYNEYFIKNTQKLNFVAATIDQIKFNELKYVVNAQNNQVDRVWLAQTTLDKANIQGLFDKINAKMPNAKVEVDGLPIFSKNGSLEGISTLIAIDWTDADKNIRFILDVPEKLQDSEADKNMIIPFSETNSTALLKAFKHYMVQIEHSSINIVITSKKLTADLASHDMLAGSFKPSF